jgi:hypothetical protein
MSSDHEAEIRASVAAHADLGPGYDAAVAEGLVERIGEEIDRRIDARLGREVPGHQVPGHQVPGHRGPAAPAGAQPGVPTPAGAAGVPDTAGLTGAATPAGPAGYQPYQGYQGYLGPMLPPGYQLGPPPARPSQVGTRSVANTVTALGSIALGVAATAIVAHGDTAGGPGFIILLIWVAIAVINVAYARRP